jgi:hypothetical protein
MKPAFISERLSMLLLAISTIAMIVLAVLFAFAPDLRSDENYDTNALSRSAVGFSGLVRYLSLAGIPVAVDRGPMGRGIAAPSLIILTPNANTTAADIAGYEHRAPLLIIMPKWTVVPDQRHPGWVMKFSALPVSVLSQQLRHLSPKAVIVRGSGTARNVGLFRGWAAPSSLPVGSIAHIEELQSIRGGDPILATWNRGDVVVSIPQKQGAVYVVSEPDLLNNHGLADQGAATQAMALIKGLRRGDGPVWMDVTLDGLGRKPNLLRALMEPPFLGATLCLAIAALLVCVRALARFGAPVTAAPSGRGKRALVAGTAQLVRIMHREGAMAPRYVTAMREHALARLGARRSGPAEQDRLLASLEDALARPVSYQNILAEAQTAGSADDLRRVAAKAYDWQKGVTGGNR